jgi:periplasmic divalent cation tolerance protein
MSKNHYVIALVTAADKKTARHLAHLALKKRLVACANLVPGIESHYWWQGKLESSAELLILFKTRESHRQALEQLILSHHPYETPEFLILPIAAGTAKYLDWIEDSTEPEPAAEMRRPASKRGTLKKTRPPGGRPEQSRS